jgi:hypothetical protein
LRNSAHENDSRRSPFRAHSDSCAQFPFRPEPEIAPKPWHAGRAPWVCIRH